MSLRSKAPNRSERPASTDADIRKGAMDLYRKSSLIIDDSKIVMAEGVDRTLVKLGETDSGVLIGSIKIRGDKTVISPNQIMANGKVFSTRNGKEIPYGHGIRERFSSIVR